MKIFAVFFLVSIAFLASPQLRADDCLDAKINEAHLKADAIQVVADAATKKAKDDPSNENKAAADAANIAAAEAVIDAAGLDAEKLISGALTESEHSKAAEPATNADKSECKD